MVHQFVFGLEWLHVSVARFPVTDVIVIFRPSNVIHSDVLNYVVHGAELSVAALFRVFVNPFTRHVLQ